MDYPRWELDRQRRALGALLLGAGTDRDPPEAPNGRHRPADSGESPQSAAGQVPQAAGGGHAANPGEDRVAVREAGRDRPEEESAALDAAAGARERFPGPEAGGPEEAPDASPLRRRPLPETSARRLRASGETEEALRAAPPPQGVENAGETPGGERPAGKPLSKTQGDGQIAGPIPSGVRAEGALPALGRRDLPWESGASAALRAEEDARALSRAVQRDARRYDGGFIIY